MRSVTLPRTDDAKTNAVIARLESIMQAVLRAPLDDAAAIVENVVLGTSDVQVPHGLGRPPRGWIVVKANAGETVFSITISSNLAKFINLRASGTVTVSILFF